jgi:hypothetical protein
MKKISLLTLFLSLSLLIAGCGKNGSSDSSSSDDNSADSGSDDGNMDDSMAGMDGDMGDGSGGDGGSDIPTDFPDDNPPDGGSDIPTDFPDDNPPDGGSDIPTDFPDDNPPDGGSDIPTEFPEGDPPNGGSDIPADGGSDISGDPAGGGGNKTNRYPVGSAEYVSKKILLAAASGKMNDLQDVIGSKATGLLGEIRDGKLSADKMAILKQRMSKVQLAKKPYTVLFDRYVVLRNAQGTLIQFRCRREGQGYKVVALTFQGGNPRGK